jgi:hypothetical protein
METSRSSVPQVGCVPLLAFGEVPATGRPVVPPEVPRDLIIRDFVETRRDWSALDDPANTGGQDALRLLPAPGTRALPHPAPVHEVLHPPDGLPLERAVGRPIRGPIQGAVAHPRRLPSLSLRSSPRGHGPATPLPARSTPAPTGPARRARHAGTRLEQGHIGLREPAPGPLARALEPPAGPSGSGEAGVWLRCVRDHGVPWPGTITPRAPRAARTRVPDRRPARRPP